MRHVQTTRRARQETDDERRARLAVRAQITRWGWNDPDLAHEAGVDTSTVRRMLAGAIWPQRGTLGRIEAALGWSPDILQRIADGEADPPPIEDLPPDRRRDIERVANLPPDVSQAEMVELLDYLDWMRARDRRGK